MTSFGFQLYSLHAVDDQLPAVIERVGETGFEGVEFAGLSDADVESVDAALDRSGLGVAGAHIGLDKIEANADGIAETYRALGCETVAVPWLDPERFASETAVEETAERVSNAAAALAEHGLELHYHNHDQEFTELDGRPALEYLLEATDDVGLQLDLGWVGAAGYEPFSFLEAHAERIDLVHLKDYDAAAGETVEVGEGDLDVDATVELVKELEVDWLVYEAEDRPGSYGTLDHAADIVEAHW
ncbi:Xylose isomerase domain protein TIM barrel (plasmid) [Haloterrigena turkmenica DSM 5511]|uniref:Xylose isomerase domain protein TIM barrel n=1 Tax=Haloterrigena turkmenica (strain ATCC 51198 / DSM 5511 / JCM 9101 / NCIMB 13204 / VKM B-1734 / 4k) TaxID=543526 RepID=D2S247_HALTV|nr:sugar phosphate isomerase/epimerase [Haloterrigena turkmenica]ADB63444.1 Xylose isomerase domain protein TIM barrel [Haloterrigena turkmenica DSM 5511]